MFCFFDAVKFLEYIIILSRKLGIYIVNEWERNWIISFRIRFFFTCFVSTMMVTRSPRIYTRNPLSIT